MSKGNEQHGAKLPHCGWHKSQTGTVAAWIVALVILALLPD
jgi:hypothetical protein